MELCSVSIHASISHDLKLQDEPTLKAGILPDMAILYCSVINLEVGRYLLNGHNLIRHGIFFRRRSSKCCRRSTSAYTHSHLDAAL
jgi:hypothetical protein